MIDSVGNKEIDPLTTEALYREVIGVIVDCTKACGTMITTDTNLLLDLDVDSLALIELVTTLERKFKVVLFTKDTGYRDLETIDSIVALIQKTRNPTLSHGS